jgi:hypothetical protein
MDSISFRERVCRVHDIPESKYVGFVLRHSVFTRFFLLSPLITIFIPDIFFQEHHLIERVGRSTTLREVQEEIDYYQHKYVVNSVFKDALKFRISGMRLMKFASQVYRSES